MHLLPLRSCLQLLALASASASLAVTNDFLSVLERADAAAVRNDESTALYVFLSALSPHPDAEYALRRIADLSPDAASRAQLTNTLNSCLALLDLPAQRIAISLLASLCRSLGDSAAAQSYFAALAPLTNWLIVGGFDNAERAGLTTRFPPEFRLGCRETYQGKQWPVRWRPALPLRHNFGVDLQLIRPTSWLTAYLRTGLLAPTTTCALLIIDFPGAFRLWLNGQPLAEETQYREPHNEMYFVPLTLREGTNLIVAKLCSSHNNVTFLTRLALPNGTPLFLHSLQPDDATIPLSCQTTSQWPRPLPSPGVRRWEAAFLANSNDQHTALMLARYYAVTRRDEQAIARFEALLPSPHLSPADLVSLARCHARRKSPSQAAALYRRALQRDPLANAARTSLALHYLNRNMYDLALPILQEALARATNDLYARLALISLYRARNWNEDAFRLARETCTLFPLHDRAHRAAAQTAADSSFDASAEASYLAALSCRPPNYAERDALIRLYQRQRRFDTAARHIELLRTYHPTDPLPWILAARSAFLQRDPDAGIPICQAALTLFPDHPTFHQHLGDFFYMRGQRDHAINAYRACLTYEPNFLWLRRYLDFLTEKSDAFFLKYDLSDQTCKKRATAALRLPLPRDERQSSVIFRRALVQLYQDGSSRQQFHFMVRVLSPRGVQAASSVHLPPGQLLRAVTYKPDGRILEATHLDVGQIEFPDVQVGDVIEYKYRTDRYGGSWLDQHFFSIFAFDVAQSDVQRADVVLAVPTNRLVSWFSQPHRLPPRKSLLDGYHVFHWSLRNIPIFSVEPSAPAYLDVAHSLALSTIPNWHTIAEWQRAMLSDLTRADADVHRLAREITRHATSDAQRVAAIFSFITANFRYTRMYESSIASIKPHPLPDILANRCGDCKDLSLLMIELLKACAISSFPALIRTIDNGHLVTNVPAPDVFNHMIVYIPALHHGLFVDPTFRHGEWDLLPASCQGVWAFVVDDSSYRFIRTPIAPPHDALTALCFSGVIAPDGSCTGTMHISLHRLDAATARASLESMDDWRKIGSYYVARIEPNSRLTSFAALHATPTNLPLILSIGFSAPRFAQPSDAFLSLSLPWPLEPEEIHGGLEHRTHPLRLDSLHEENRQYQLHLPKGASCSIPTTNLFLHSPFGSFSFSASQHNNLLLASWRLSLSQRDIPTNTYPSFRRFLSRCATATSQLILIHLPPSPPHQPNPASLPSLPLPN